MKSYGGLIRKNLVTMIVLVAIVLLWFSHMYWDQIGKGSGIDDLTVNAQLHELMLQVHFPAVDETALTSPQPSTVQQAPEPTLIDLNLANVLELQRLPGIGPSKAQAIVDYRMSVGPFSIPEELMNVKGIGAKTYEKLKDQIVVNVEIEENEEKTDGIISLGED